MGVFDCLPNLETCCYCIPLKIGCIIIAILTLLLGLARAVFAVLNIVLDSNNLLWPCLNGGVSLFLVISGIVLLVGIFASNGVCLTTFMWLTLVWWVAHGAVLIANLVIKYSEVSMMLGVITACLGLIIVLYDMVIVNSFKNEEGLD